MPLSRIRKEAVARPQRTGCTNVPLLRLYLRQRRIAKIHLYRYASL